jgi:hypothetical protein
MKVLGVFKRHAIRVQRSAQTYHEEQGWERHAAGWFSTKTQLRGFYRTPYGSFEGEIALNGSSPSFYIIHPPAALKSHSHWICFHYRGSDRYWIHFSQRPKDIDSGIMSVERMLNEAFRQA